MRGVKRTVPLFVVCQRHGCCKLREVRCPKDQQRAKYCSRRCAAIVNRNIRHATRGVVNSVRKRRVQVLKRVEGLSPLAAFLLGYKRGLQSKIRQLRRRYDLVPKERPHGHTLPAV